MMKFAQALRNMRDEESGFTLIELMVVVVIIGILAAVAIPQFANIISNSKIKADIATGKTIKDAIDRYYTDKGSYPSDGSDVSVEVGTLLTDGYLSSAPKFAQNSGGDYSAAKATFDIVFKSDASGNVTVYQLKSDGTQGVKEWTSASN